MFIETCSGHIDWIRDILTHSAEDLLLENLSPLAICLIGTLAHVNATFRAQLKEKITSCRSPLSLGRTAFADHLFETTFGLASVESNSRLLMGYEMQGFLELVGRDGSVSMIKTVLDIGIYVDVKDESRIGDLLGSATAEGRIDVLYMLLEAGANGSLSVGILLDNSKYISDEDFRRILELLVENARVRLISDSSSDPLLAILKSSRALSSYPEAPRILLDRKVFDQECFGKGASKAGCEHSYMCQAILRGNSSVLDLLLRNGAYANEKISDSFHCRLIWCKCSGYCTASYTWITFSVLFGAPNCTDVLIHHGADVTTLDGAGRSALRLARDFALGSHPRPLDRTHPGCGGIAAQKDAENLAVVERAFNDKCQGTMTLEGYYNSNEGKMGGNNGENNEDFPPPSPPQDKPASLSQKTFNKTLTIILTPTQIKLLHHRLRYHSYEIRKIWSLSFYEALFLRFIYVLSYTLLLTFELNALIKGHKRLQMPSRYFLSALAVLALALMWASSLLGYSWGSVIAGSNR